MAIEKSVTSRFTTLYVDPTVMKRIGYYTQAADGEVSGLGTLKKDEKGRYIVDEVYLLEQESSAADTEIKPESISKLMVDMMKDNKDPGALKFWWHSHASMGVFWSGTDDTCAETLSKEFAFSLVVNKAGDKKCRLDLYDPFRITFDGVRIEELTQDDMQLKEACEKEVKEKVKSPSERWQNWKDKDIDSYHGYCGGDYYNSRTHEHSNVPRTIKPEISSTVADDIEALIEQSERHQEQGAMLCMDTWSSFIMETMRKVAEQRFEKKAGCNSFGTYDPGFATCKEKACDTIKPCKFWSKIFEEYDKESIEKDEIEVINCGELNET